MDPRVPASSPGPNLNLPRCRPEMHSPDQHLHDHKEGQNDANLSALALPLPVTSPCHPHPLQPNISPGPSINASDLLQTFSSTYHKPFPSPQSTVHSSPSGYTNPTKDSFTYRHPETPSQADNSPNQPKPKSLPTQPSPITSPPTMPTPQSTIRAANTRTRQILTVRFAEVAAHTAKCDDCDVRNRDGMSRCLACGWQCCRKCLNARGGDRTHQSFTSVHTPETERRSANTRQADGEPTLARSSTSTQEAAETLVGISGSATSTPSRRREVSVAPRGQEMRRMTISTAAARRDSLENCIRERVEVETDDDETLTDLSTSEDDDAETSNVPWGGLGLFRRNPPRASRPSALAE